MYDNNYTHMARKRVLEFIALLIGDGTKLIEEFDKSAVKGFIDGTMHFRHCLKDSDRDIVEEISRTEGMLLKGCGAVHLNEQLKKLRESLKENVYGEFRNPVRK